MSQTRNSFGYNRIIIELLGDDAKAPPLSDIDAFNERIQSIAQSMDKNAYVHPLRCWDENNAVWISEIEDVAAMRHDVERIVRGVLPLIVDCRVVIIALDENKDREIRFSFEGGDAYRDVELRTGTIQNEPWHQGVAK